MVGRFVPTGSGTITFCSDYWLSRINDNTGPGGYTWSMATTAFYFEDYLGNVLNKIEVKIEETDFGANSSQLVSGTLSLPVEPSCPVLCPVEDGTYYIIEWVYAQGYAVNHDQAPASVPELNTMLLLGSGLIGLVGLRRRLRK